MSSFGGPDHLVRMLREQGSSAVERARLPRSARFVTPRGAAVDSDDRCTLARRRVTTSVARPLDDDDADGMVRRYRTRPRMPRPMSHTPPMRRIQLITVSRRAAT